ncbi:pentachlorophenol monooxygenase [Saccharomonospora sp. CUA-673]|nr:pentachlorophenol monooxygenase [Saccharomonospora sp. CUA-673]
MVGNGPVGQTAALLLARWGVPVMLLDARAERDRAGSKAICQQRDVLDIWESVAAGRRIADEGLTWRTARTFHRDSELFAHELAAGPAGSGGSAFPPFVNISQARVEEILDECIAGQPLIDVRWAHDVTGIDEHGHGVTLTCGDGTRVEAAYVVVCAGARAESLRAALGVTFAGRSFDDRFLICDIRAELRGWARERRSYFDPSWNPGRQVLIHPCPDGVFRIDWQVPGDYDVTAEQASGALDERIRAIIGDTDYEIVWMSVYRFHSRVADRMRSGRVLLAGDCAHLYAPFGARGLNSGVADAENAAWKLAWVLRGWAGDELLESYHHERHAAALENLAVTAATMDFLVPHDERQRRRRRTVLGGAATDARLREQVDSGRLAEPFWYGDSPLTTVDPTRPAPGRRPPRGQAPAPGPGVLVPDVPLPSGSLPGRARLRELARDGFLLLAPEGAAGIPDPPTAAPLRIVPLAEVDPAAAVLGAREGEWWVVRPDAHIAGVAGDPAAVEAVLRRASAGLAAPVPP